MQRAMIRRTPNGNTAPFPQPFQRLFDQALGDFWSTDEETTHRNWVPPVDISESDERLTFTAELPGLTKENVEITVEDRILTLTGERRMEKEVKESERNFHRVERVYGTFQRSFRLPNNVRTDEVKASFADGILTIELPKAEEAKARKIEIA